MVIAVTNRHGRVKRHVKAIGLAHAAMELWLRLEKKGCVVSTEFLKDKALLKVSRGDTSKKLYLVEV